MLLDNKGKPQSIHKPFNLQCWFACKIHWYNSSAKLVRVFNTHLIRLMAHSMRLNSYPTLLRWSRNWVPRGNTNTHVDLKEHRGLWWIFCYIHESMPCSVIFGSFVVCLMVWFCFCLLFVVVILFSVLKFIGRNSEIQRGTKCREEKKSKRP